MTPLTAAERQRLERHRVQCPLAVVHLSCDTCILLDALDATEKERDEARRVIEAVREFAPSVPGLKSVLRPLLPQPDEPAATAETCDRWHVTQTILHDPSRPNVQGNCLQALVASMLGVPLDTVPHFVQTAADTGSDWLADLVQWLFAHGWDLRYVPPSELKQAGTYIETGPSARGVQHCVLYRHGDTWDPHPSRAGLLSVSMRYSVSRSPAAPRVTASGSWLVGTASIAGFCGECGLAAGSDGCAHGDGAV